MFGLTFPQVGACRNAMFFEKLQNGASAHTYYLRLLWFYRGNKHAISGVDYMDQTTS